MAGNWTRNPGCGDEPQAFDPPAFLHLTTNIDYDGLTSRAGVAQMVEPRFRKPRVARSSRVAGSKPLIRCGPEARGFCGLIIRMVGFDSPARYHIGQ